MTISDAEQVLTGDQRPFGNYEIRSGEDGYAIGGIGFHGAPDADSRVTIGYGLVPSARGNGYASEALRALLAGMRLSVEDEQLRYYAVDWASVG